MIRYLIGIDGGGSKTDFLCVDMDGRHIASAYSGGTYYRQEGIDAVVHTLKKGILTCMDGKNAKEVAVCFGMPGYGENGDEDAEAAKEIAASLAPCRVCFRNDVAAGWAGALALESGISIVGGTGSMAYGRDPAGNEARCGGWHEFFSDEGSGYWLGKKTLELFCKQSDGRLEKGAIYSIVKRELSLKKDLDLIGLTEREFARSRKNTAALQMLLLEAARSGDIQALDVYARAAEELSAIICGTAKQLDFAAETIDVSYAGGLFHIEDLILEQMIRNVKRKIRAEFQKPILSPCEGAVLFAAEQFVPERLKMLKKKLIAGRQKAGG